MSAGAVVTGAGRGLGLEIARELAGRGYRVHVSDVDPAAAERAAQTIGGETWFSPLDVSDPAACQAVARATAERAGALEVWVNNAGILPVGYAWEHPPEQRTQTFAVNALGTINGTLAALELMRPQGRGHVINVVSLAGLVAAPGETLYSASKHAALAFSTGTLLDLRRAGERDVHISAVCPDGIWTPMLYDKVENPDAALSWSGVLLSPEYVARRAVALLDAPRPILALPPWRGWVARLYAASPRAAIRLLPLVMADARRKQRKFKRSLDSRPA
jgi:NAD(P)-dependent dehydrogenase (short-subunit alcohol dehydrogenase family)